MKKKKNKVDCKKIEKLIPLYLDNKLSSYEMLALLNHVEECKNCKEELTIQYMVNEGIKRAEEQNDYNLLNGLDEKILASRKQIRAHDFVYFAFVLCMLAIVCIIIAAVLFIFYY